MSSCLWLPAIAALTGTTTAILSMFWLPPRGSASKPSVSAVGNQLSRSPCGVTPHSGHLSLRTSSYLSPSIVPGYCCNRGHAYPWTDAAFPAAGEVARLGPLSGVDEDFVEHPGRRRTCAGS